MIALALLASLLASPPPLKVSKAPCQTEAECWLDADGNPIARPKSKQGRPIPRGNCGALLVWLRNELSCQENVCVARLVGDRC
jgi:hypothetical protein